ncbi:MAG TPA: Wzz/FepE/Etk N-terminal domain-containing protein [Candidatus Limnocylindrales bacterium]|nr:Wzz/FepE/Etk N-terminal domain-containing protein [Candidatus Limnocylindrales bacterium]HET9520813.1 Wzz/FepE/Etk N-terminal domain-containing protein [Candidatus Limnocylindrales bacterium]
MELSGYLAVAKRWWWTLVVAAWVAGLTGYLVASTLPPTYESQVKVLVGPLNTDLDTLRASGQLIQTYAQVVTTDEVLASTIQELGLDLTPEELRSATRSTANDVTRILTIRVQAGDPEQAAKLANELATELEQLTSGGISRPEGLTKILEFARPDTVPVAPQVSLLVLLAALAGVVVAVIVVLLIEYFGNTVRTREELASLARAPGLGVVPAPSGNPVGLVDLVVERAPDSRSAAPYRLIAAKLALSGDDEPVRSILVTDADWEAEAAIVAGNLAAALAKLGRPVVLIDGSGPDGTLTALNGWKGRDGLAELLTDSVRPASRTDAGVRVVPAGHDETAAVDPDRMTELIGALAGQHGVVVIVGGPIQASPNTLALARATDGVILVARRDRARREDVVFAGESLRLVGSSILGTILTERGGARRLRREQGLPSAAPALPLDVQPATSAVRIATRRRPRGEPPVAAPDRAPVG